MNKPVVSVLMITYNHEKYISEAIEGVLMQKTTFPIELIIGEDFSTDNTRKIVLAYAEKYPDIIRLLLPESNLGMMKNFIGTLKAATGRYIALCEGDDYWIDSYKLQKQVDFLEANEDYSICSHRYRVLDQLKNEYSNDLNENKFLQYESYFDFDKNTYFSGWYTHTLTVVFRNNPNLIKEISKYTSMIDYTLFYIVIGNSKGRLINFEGAIYRKHSGGVWSNSSNKLKNHVLLYSVFKELYNENRTDALVRSVYNYHIKNYLRAIYRYGTSKEICKTSVVFKDYLNTKTGYVDLFILFYEIFKSTVVRLAKCNLK